MFDATGEGWIRHMMYGTSRLLAMLGPRECLDGRAKSVLQEVRIFEITRSMLFGEPTFLVSPRWKTTLESFNASASDLHEHQLSAVLDCMGRCADLLFRYVIDLARP